MTDALPCPFHNVPPQIDWGFSDAPHALPYISCSIVYRDEAGDDHTCECGAHGFAAWNTRALTPEVEPPGTRAEALASTAQAVIDHYARIHAGQRFRTHGQDLIAVMAQALTAFQEVKDA